MHILPDDTKCIYSILHAYEPIIHTRALRRINDSLIRNDLSLQPAEFWEGKRVIEMEKSRPVWFNKNLLQKTTQPAAKTTEVKPTNLG